MRIFNVSFCSLDSFQQISPNKKCHGCTSAPFGAELTVEGNVRISPQNRHVAAVTSNFQLHFPLVIFPKYCPKIVSNSPFYLKLVAFNREALWKGGCINQVRMMKAVAEKTLCFVKHDFLKADASRPINS